MTQHQRSGTTNGGIRVEFTSERRQGICEKCGVPVEKIKMDTRGDGVMRPVLQCPQCKGLNTGRLIVRVVSIQPPKPPECLSFRCIFRWMKESFFVMLLASYHRRRVEYAQVNKNKKILERYRTGEPAPKTLWQAIHANIKLSCSICRRYNVDPLLGGGGKKNGSNSDSH